jgi:hypothetical protein
MPSASSTSAAVLLFQNSIGAAISEAAIAGVDVVYHLAHPQCRTGQDYKDNEIGPMQTVRCSSYEIKQFQPKFPIFAKVSQLQLSVKWRYA